MCKNNKKPIKHRKVETVSITDEDQSDQPRTAIRKVDVPEEDFLNYKKKKPMLKKLLASKIVRGIGSVLGGVLGAGGSILAGLDPEFAVLVGVTAIIAIFGGIKKAQAFYDIFEDDVKEEKQTK